MLLSQEIERIEKGEPVCLEAIAMAWTERHIKAGLASHIQVHSLTEQLSAELQIAVRNGQLNVYDMFRNRERPYRCNDEPELNERRVWLLPRSVDAWLEKEKLNPTLMMPRIEPPDGWMARCTHGLQRVDKTDAGRLVRLADLVQWLMDTRELPCKVAVEAVCSILELRLSASADWLFLLTEHDYAKPLTGADSFFWVPDPLSFWETAPQVQETDKGAAGAIKYMREYWAQSPSPSAGNRMGQHVLDPLAIRLDVAHLQWGYGRRLDAVEQVEPVAPVEPANLASEEKRRVLKKKVLIEELQGEWPTIIKDLSDASRNGLKAAKAEGHGMWDVEKASEWAESRGKRGRRKSAQENTLNSVWPGKGTIHRSS